LTDREDMHVAFEESKDSNQRVDIIVEVKTPRRQRHIARVLPIRDVDLVARQEGLDRTAQQCGEVSGHECDQQHAWVLCGSCPSDFPLEVQGHGKRAFTRPPPH
jgi:hypothetical protein